MSQSGSDFPRDAAPFDLCRAANNTASKMTPSDHHTTEGLRGARKPATLRDLLACLSLANLCFLGVSIELSGTNLYYFRKTPPSGTMLAAAILCIVSLAMLMWGAVALIRKSRSARLKNLARFAFLLFLLIPLNVARTSVAEFSRVTDAVTSFSSKLLVGIAVLTLAIVVVRRGDAVVRIATGGLLFLSPLLAMTLGQAVWTYARRPPDAAFASSLPVVQTGDRSQTRILWMLFDEWDYRLAFDKRPAGLILPEMDRLREESFSATMPWAEGSEFAMPSRRF